MNFFSVNLQVLNGSDHQVLQAESEDGLKLWHTNVIKNNIKIYTTNSSVL
jgi:hypothetical protein